MFKKIVGIILMLSMLASPTYAQLGLPYTSFQPGQSISSAQFTANFTAISANALNRTGGTMTGTLTLNGGLDINGSVTIGSSNLQPFNAAGQLKELTTTYLADLNAVLGNITVTGLSCTGCIGATQLESTAVSPATYGNGTSTIAGVLTVDADGRLTSVTQIDASALTGLLEANITDGTVFPRLAENETIIGNWITQGSFTVSTALPTYLFSETDQGVDGKTWGWISNNGVASLAAFDDAVSAGTNSIAVTRSGTTITAITLTGADINLTGTTIDVIGAVGITGNTYVNGTFGTASSVAVGTTLSVGGASTLAAVSATSLSVSGAFSFTSTLVGDGAVSTPSYSFTSSTNSGMYYASGRLVLADGGVDAMQMDGAGTIRVLLATTFYNAITPFGAGINIGDGSNRWNGIFLVDAPNVSSDARLKKEVKTTSLGIEFIDKLRPREYRLISNPDTLHYGFIAQDLLELNFQGVTVDKNGMMGIRYEELLSPIVKGLQDVHNEIHALDVGSAERDQALLAIIQKLNQRIDSLEAQLEKRVE